MAFFNLGHHYMEGDFGLPRDPKRAVELWLQAGKLGFADKGARHYWELSAMGGNVDSRYNLGVMEDEAGNYERAIRHWLISAGAGSDNSLVAIRNCYSKNLVTKEIFGKALRAHQKATDEMKSDQRVEAAAYRSKDN
ncbi:hypothetical protein ACHAWF_000994 [Thalassiosira exigua]